MIKNCCEELKETTCISRYILPFKKYLKKRPKDIWSLYYSDEEGFKIKQILYCPFCGEELKEGLDATK